LKNPLRPSKIAERNLEQKNSLQIAAKKRCEIISSGKKSKINHWHNPS